MTAPNPIDILRELLAQVDKGGARIESIAFEVSVENPNVVKLTVVAADSEVVKQ